MNSILLVAALACGAGSPEIEFDTDVVPVLTKAGCNAAACHGAAAGRGGFKLSLFGGDAESDYHAIVHEFEGRRVNLAEPARSLVVLKPAGEMEHEGGVRLGEDDAATLVRWIEAGAARDQVRWLTGLQLDPTELLVDRVPNTVPLRVVADFNDGTHRDVTHRAVYISTDPAAVEVDRNGRLTVLRRGRHAVIVRYLSIVKTVQITAPLNDEPIDVTNAPRGNWIDDEVLDTLRALRLPLSPQADDATMLRRARLDLTGRLPAPEEVRNYLADKDPRKFPKLVERLLDSPEFAEYWTYKLAKLLRIRASAQEAQGARAFHAWVYRQIELGTPLHEFAVALLTSEGDTHINGPANFHRVAGDARGQAEYASELLMGARLRCANCHNHPLDRWTQDDYHGLAAIFARVERGRIIRTNPRGEVSHPRTGQAAVPRIPGERFLDAEDNGPAALAQWLSAADNPYFATAMVNRVWQAMMGRGLVDPADDLRATNPATHPALLEKLAADFIEHGYDLRHSIRLIATSAAYARGSQARDTNRADDRFYSHALVRALEPEVMADAIADVTGVADQYGNEPHGTRAVALFNPATPSPALDILGRCSREDSCEAETAFGAQGGLTTKLHLLNGELINRKITAGDGRLHRKIAEEGTTAELIEQFYLRALSRFPNDDERTFWEQELTSTDNHDRQQRLEDFVWSLLSCREFSTNH